MVKGIKFFLIFAILIFVALIVSGNETNTNVTSSIPNVNSNYPQVSGNEANTNVAPSIEKVNSNYPQYPQYTPPDIELQTSYISDILEASKTYEYKVQVKNLDNKEITIDPRLNANYPIVYPMKANAGTAMAGSGNASSAQPDSAQSNSAQSSSNVLAPSITSVPSIIPVTSRESNVNKETAVSSGVSNSYAKPMISSPNNGHAFGNDAVKISAPSTIKAGEIVNMTIIVTVPDNSTGSYYSSIDMNVNNEENNPYNPQLSLSFTVQQPLTVPYVKTFSTETDAPVMIEVSADSYRSDMGTRISPKIEDPAFDLGLTCNGNPVTLLLVKSVESGNVGAGNIYPVWVSTAGNTYQSYGEHFVKIYKAQGAVGNYEFSILPKNIYNFGYSITIGNNSI